MGSSIEVKVAPLISYGTDSQGNPTQTVVGSHMYLEIWDPSGARIRQYNGFATDANGNILTIGGVSNTTDTLKVYNSFKDGEYFAGTSSSTKATHPHSGVEILSNLSSSSVNSILNMLDLYQSQLNSAGLDYFPLGDVFGLGSAFNSNSALAGMLLVLKPYGVTDDIIDDVDDAAVGIGGNVGFGDDIFPEMTPDWLNNLDPGAGSQDSDGDGRTDTPPDFPPPTPPTPPYLWPLYLYPPLWPFLPDLKLSPLVLDLDGDGVELYKLGDYGSYFDLTGDGQAELTGWVAPDDGLLALDVNADGIINDISELFGSSTTDGFTLLSVHDGNGDGKINASDAVFDDLLIWTDTNSDGVSQSTELHTLASLNIASISLDATRLVNQEIEGNSITHSASYTLTNNTTRTIVDAWFDFDPLHTRNIQDYDFDIRTAFLPTLKGYGDLKDLHIAASIDNGAASTSLIERLIAFSSGMTLTSALSNWASVTADVEDILFRWAGIESINTASRGQYVDAQHLAFYEAFRNESFSQYGNPNPRPDAGKFVEAVYDYFQTAITVQLLTQIDGSSIFSDAYYDGYAGGINGDLALLQAGIDAVKETAIAAVDAVEVWTHFAQFLGYTKGLGNLTSLEISALDTAVAATNDPSLTTWGSVVAAMETNLGNLIEGHEDWVNFELPYENRWLGSPNDDTVTDNNQGGNTNNEFRGRDGNDTINGLDGNDSIYGENGNDTLIGGTGDDLLVGGAGDDIYIYTAGNDTFTESGGSGLDEIRIAASTGLIQSNMTLYRQGTEMHILFSNGGSIIIDNYAATGASIEKIIFEFNNTEINLLTLVQEIFEGTAGFDNIAATGLSYQTLVVSGYAGNDTLSVVGAHGKLYGGDGYDTLYGGALSDELYGENGEDYLLGGNGDDLLYGGAGKDWLNGGEGNDVLNGGDGDDTFIFGIGSGNDFITRTSYNNDRIQFSSNVLPADLALIRSASATERDDLVFEIISTGEKLTVEDMYSKNNAWLYRIQKFSFSDGTLWTDETLRYKYIADHTTIGNDTVIGFETNDTFQKSSGDDLIYGYSGADTYYWGAGAGNDTIVDQLLFFINGNGDRVIFDALNVRDLTYSINASQDLVITILSTSEILTIQDYSLSPLFAIENFEFSNGIVYTNSQLNAGTSNSDNFTGTSTIAIYSGSGGIDTVNYSSSTSAISIDLQNNTASGGHAQGDILMSIEGITGSNYNDTIYGSNNNDIIQGGAGNDVLAGGGGVDTLSYAAAGALVTVNLSTTIAQNTNAAGTDTISEFENLTGSNYNDTLSGDSSNNIIQGQNGNDTIKGREGDDILYGDAGTDYLEGNEGSDILYGGAGADTLKGSDGIDTFAWMAMSEAGDTIQDYNYGAGEKLNIANLLVGFNPLNKLITDFVRITDSGANSVIEIDTNGTIGGVSFVHLATLTGITGLTDELAMMNSGRLIAV